MYYDSFISYHLMKKINLAVTGCMGRMVQQIIKSVNKDKNYKLVSLTENKKNKKKISNIPIELKNIQVLK